MSGAPFTVSVATMNWVVTPETVELTGTVAT